MPTKKELGWSLYVLGSVLFVIVAFYAISQKESQSYIDLLLLLGTIILIGAGQILIHFSKPHDDSLRVIWHPTIGSIPRNRKELAAFLFVFFFVVAIFSAVTIWSYTQEKEAPSLMSLLLLALSFFGMWPALAFYRERSLPASRILTMIIAGVMLLMILYSLIWPRPPFGA